MAAACGNGSPDPAREVTGRIATDEFTRDADFNHLHPARRTPDPTVAASCQRCAAPRWTPRVGRRDLVKAYVDACHELGMRVGFYYSHEKDWFHHAKLARARGPLAESHIELVKTQVTGLLTKYGQIAVIWFDTPSPEGTFPGEDQIRLQALGDWMAFSLNDHVRFRTNPKGEIRAVPGFDLEKGREYEVVYSPYPEGPEVEIVTLVVE